jgi:hypothetical protein
MILFPTNTANVENFVSNLTNKLMAKNKEKLLKTYSLSEIDEDGDPSPVVKKCQLKYLQIK